jgi:N-acetylglucosamine-6-sulfatase
VPLPSLRHAQRIMLILLFSGVLTQTLPARDLQAQAVSARPNIVLVLADDLDLALIDQLPRLRELMTDQGTSFANSFVNQSTCCPSRVSILRGQYAHNHQVLTNFPDVSGGFETFQSLHLEQSTIGTWLQSAGYRTALLGKYLNNYPKPQREVYVPPGWDEWFTAFGKNQYNEFEYRYNANGKVAVAGTRPEDDLTDVLTDRAVQFIEQSAQAQQPFFVYLAPFVPHEPANPPPRYQNEFQGVQAPRVPSFNEDDVADKPFWVRQLPQLDSQQIAAIDALYRKRLRTMLAVEDMVDRVIQTLQSAEQLDNTYIFFTSDNGLSLGEHRRTPAKLSAYDEDTHMPLIVRGPGVPAGKILPYLVGNVDLAPTFAALAGVQTPDFVDGRSLVPLWGASPPADADWRQGFLIEHWRARDRLPDYSALRTQRYLYVEYVTGERELYDIEADPFQLNNIQASADRPLLHRLSDILQKLRNCGGTECQTAETQPATAR